LSLCCYSFQDERAWQDKGVVSENERKCRTGEAPCFCFVLEVNLTAVVIGTVSSALLISRNLGITGNSWDLSVPLKIIISFYVIALVVTGEAQI
jgi:hypothetical protein